MHFLLVFPIKGKVGCPVGPSVEIPLAIYSQPWNEQRRANTEIKAFIFIQQKYTDALNLEPINFIEGGPFGCRMTAFYEGGYYGTTENASIRKTKVS